MIRTALSTTGLAAAATIALGGVFLAGRAAAPAAITHAAQPEEMDQPSPEQMKAMMEAGAAKAPEHDRLEHLVGSWDAEVSFLSEPGGEPETSRMTAEIRTILDGRYVQSHYAGTFRYMGIDFPFEGHGMIGYDKAKGAYTSAWADNLSTSMLVQVGPFADGAIDLKGEMPDGMGGQVPMRHLHIINDDGSYTLEFRQPNPATGEMTKIGWIHHTKK